MAPMRIFNVLTLPVLIVCLALLVGLFISEMEVTELGWYAAVAAAIIVGHVLVGRLPVRARARASYAYDCAILVLNVVNVVVNVATHGAAWLATWPGAAWLGVTACMGIVFARETVAMIRTGGAATTSAPGHRAQ